MNITNNLEVVLSNPYEEITLGINYLRGDGYPVNEITGETDYNAEPETVNRLCIGFAFFSINLYWND